MVVGASGDDVEAVSHECFGQCLSVENDLFGVVFEFGLKCFEECDGFGSIDVIVWPPLHPWENGAVDLFCPFFFAENDGATWSS